MAGALPLANIRVANFSLHSGALNHFWLDPLNVAVLGKNQPSSQKVYDRVAWK